MPVSTRLIDESNTPIALRWGFWHVAMLHDAMVKELGFEQDSPEADSISFYPESFTFEQAHTFVDESDGEVFEILPGYRFTCWR